MLVKADKARGHAVIDRQIDETFDLAAIIAIMDLIDLNIQPAIQAAEIGLIGDDADGPGLGRGTIKRALRAS
jgi:hypothetical protein